MVSRYFCPLWSSYTGLVGRPRFGGELEREPHNHGHKSGHETGRSETETETAPEAEAERQRDRDMERHRQRNGESDTGRERRESPARQDVARWTGLGLSRMG